MQNINFATATHAELKAAGYTVDVRRSQLTKKSRKSLFGVRPSLNKRLTGPTPLKAANEQGKSGKLQG